MRKIKTMILIVLASLLCGCVTDKIEVQTTRPWEGHYMTSQTFYMSTTNIVLEKDESIWVLSNRTLNRLLQNASGK